LNTLQLAGTDRGALVSAGDYELIKDYEWHLIEGTWAATTLESGEVIEMGRLILRLKSGEICSPVPWNDQNN
jgi:hypothetical protein